MTSEYITVTRDILSTKSTWLTMGLEEYQAKSRSKIKIMLLEDHILRILSSFLK